MFENKNILFVYSGLDNNLKVQQSFVFIKSLIDEFKENCNNISILTTTDEMGLFIFDENIKIYQDAINLNTILKKIDENKIDVLIAVCGDKQTDKIICKHYNKIKEKVAIFQEEYFIKDKSKLHFNNIAKQSGFCIYRKKLIQNRAKCKEFFAVSINDNFGNQVIFDICDCATINDKKFFLSHSILLKKSTQRSHISQLLKHFGEQMDIKNIPYTIHFSEYSDGKIYFDNIEFGFSFEAIFVISSKRINIQKIILNGIKSLPIYYKQCFNYFSYTYNYETNYKINYAINFEEINFVISKNNVYQYTNSQLFYRLCILNKTENNKLKQVTSIMDYKFYIQTNINYNIIYDKTYDDCILVYCDDKTLNDIGNLIIFLSLCNRLKQATNKKLYFISKTYVPLFKYCSIDCLFIIDNNLTNNIDFIIKHWNIKKVLLNSFQNINTIIDLLQTNKIDIYGLNYDDEIFYQNDYYKKKLFCEKLGLKYNEFYNDDDIVYDFCCIKDRHNYEYQHTIVNNLFFSDINASGLLYPAIEVNFDVKEQLGNAVNIILSHIKTAGIVNINISYNNGEIYINNIDITMSLPILFKLNLQYKNKYFNCLIDAILGTNIDAFARTNQCNNLKKCDKIIICNLSNNKTITIKGKTQDSILTKFKNIIGYNDKT